PKHRPHRRSAWRVDPRGRGLSRSRAVGGGEPFFQRTRRADPRDRRPLEGVRAPGAAHRMDRRTAGAHRGGARDKGLHHDRAGHTVRGPRRDRARAAQAAPRARAVPHQRTLAVARGLGRGPLASAPLDATGRRRDLFLQLPVPDRLDAARRPSHPRVQHDDRAGHPVPRRAASAYRIRYALARAPFRTRRDRPFAHDHRLTAATVTRPPTIAREDHMTLTIPVILAIIAPICGILMLVSGRWSRYPLAAIAIICLALIQTGLIPK